MAAPSGIESSTPLVMSITWSQVKPIPVNTAGDDIHCLMPFFTKYTFPALLGPRTNLPSYWLAGPDEAVGIKLVTCFAAVATCCVVDVTCLVKSVTLKDPLPLLPPLLAPPLLPPLFAPVDGITV